MIDKEKPAFVTGVLVAAGNGRRMLGISKQLYPIEGKPVICYTIESFLQCKEIKEIILVCREDEYKEFINAVSDSLKDIKHTIVFGGNTRQESVFNGINAASDKAEFFAIHDGVRPLVKPEDISACISKAKKFKASALGVPVKDTIKMVNKADVIVSTPPRENLVAIQTPQIFEAELYKTAMEQAINQNKDYTDDCQLIEAIGHSISVCHGSYENIKITTQEDIYLARAILEYRREGL